VLSLRWDKHMDMEAGCIRLERRQTKTKAPRVVYKAGEFLTVMQKAKELRDRVHILSAHGSSTIGTSPFARTLTTAGRR
jgi:hypothetical protein